jgi:predicted phage-related endonuclease
MRRQKNGQPYADRKNYICQLALERLTGKLPDQKKSEAMQNGNDMERVAALAYSFETGLQTEQTGFWYKDNVGASPDDTIVGQNGGVEYKNPLPATHYLTLRTGIIPEHYYWQIIQCMYMTGADFWDYVSHCADFPPNAQLFVKRVERSEVLEDLKKLEAELEIAEQEVQNEINYINNYTN